MASLGELVKVIVQALVSDPDSVEVREVQGEHSIIIELKVAPDDTGKVIGKQGRTAKAIRTIVRTAAIKQNKKVMVEIL